MSDWVFGVELRHMHEWVLRRFGHTDDVHVVDCLLDGGHCLESGRHFNGEHGLYLQDGLDGHDLQHLQHGLLR